MRILRVIRSVNPEVGGPIEGITQVSRALSAAGHPTEVISLDAANDPWVQQSSLRVHAVGRGGTGYGWAPGYVKRLRREAARFDAVVISGLWQFHGLGAWYALRGSGVPYFVFPHGMLDPWFKRHYPWKHWKKRLYWPWADYRLLRDARAVLFTCEEERRLARESFALYRCRERVVSYGTADPPAEADQQKASFFRAFPHLRQQRILLFLGRIHPKKGCDILLDAFRQFSSEPGTRTEARPWHLVLAGPDQIRWRAELEEQVRSWGGWDRVTFTGMLQGDLKWGAFRAADLFVLPSHQENFGIAVVEALACGTPVLVSPAVNIWREIVADRAGWACPATREDLTRTLRTWAGGSADDHAAARQHARQCFLRRFEISEVARSLLETLREEMAGARSAPDCLRT